jgi:phenylacetate-coenzyme A ligase PaaK-like adenylate-forming protein
MAAIDGALDIAETLFVLVGEPYTQAKAAVVTKTGSRAASHYAMVEAGAIGIACQAAEALDDVHLLSDKIATIQRDKHVGGNGMAVGALFHTTLLPASPKVMLNAESGDYGVLEDRECACGAVPAGFRSHLHTIRSYEKLTSEGMSFLGGDLLSLVEQVLPSRFGGNPTDYQLVEREQDGLTKVSLVVSRAVGELDQDEVVRAVLEFLRSRGFAENMMADVWAQSRTLQVVRSDPHGTPGGKILPLRTLSG